MYKKIILTIAAFLLMATSTNIVNAARLEFSPATQSFVQGCTRSVDIFVDPQSASSNAADLFLNFPNSQITQATFVDGNAYQVYLVSPNINNGATSQMRVTAFSIAPNLTSRRLFGRINFTSAANATSANFNIEFSLGNTKDSNVADANTSVDLLTSVTNGAYTFVPGVCNPDTRGPGITFINPTDGASNVTNATIFNVRFTDDVGVDLATVVININGTLFTATSPGVVVTGTPQNYNFAITTTIPFPTDAASAAIATARDLSGNSSSRQIVFNVPVPPPPVCLCDSPDFPDTVNNFLQSLGLTEITNAPGPLQLGTVGAVAVITGLAAGLNLLPFIGLIGAPGLLFTIFSYFIGKKSKKPWGLVLDAQSNKPISLATVRAYMSGTLNLIAQTISDQDGRYGFTLAAGAYRIESTKLGYIKFSQEISILPNELSSVLDIHMASYASKPGLNFSTGKFFERLYKAWYKLLPYLITFGATLALVSVIFVPSVINWIVLGLYVIALLISLFKGVEFKSRNAAVMDSSNELRIPNAVIKLFEMDTWTLVDTITTNSAGLFDYYGQPGEYGLLLTARGYTFPSKEKNKFQVIPGKYNGIVKVSLKKGGNKIALYMDPIATETPLSGNLASPFN